jgi:hypothetical protein
MYTDVFILILCKKEYLYLLMGLMQIMAVRAV